MLPEIVCKPKKGPQLLAVVRSLHSSYGCCPVLSVRLPFAIDSMAQENTLPSTKYSFLAIQPEVPLPQSLEHFSQVRQHFLESTAMATDFVHKALHSLALKVAQCSIRK